jgi:hypothetical protein
VYGFAFVNRQQQIANLVDKGVLPADDVAKRPPRADEGVAILGDDDGAVVKSANTECYNVGIFQL